ncbi:MAG: DUF6079 family protein, partial [Candidatus Poribacteria bacterium]
MLPACSESLTLLGRYSMKYRDLVQFEPIRTVIQIQEAEQLDRARELVRTFVISEQ